MKKVILAFLLVSIQFINADAQSEIRVENEVAFSKLYGYVRYFHPSDEAATLDWNRFVIYGSKKVALCNTPQELKATLLGLFKPIAPTIQISAAEGNITFDKSGLIPADTTGYKTIAWQHIGVGTILDKRSIYKSARTNRPVIYPPAQSKFGSLAQNIDAALYRGKVFKLTAKVKIISGTGTGHLWARINNTNKTIGFFDNMDYRPINSASWSSFDITGKIDSNAAQLFTGVFMQGDGELWVDDFTVSVNIDGKWQIIYSNTFDNRQTGIGNTGFLIGGVKGQPSPDYTYSLAGDDAKNQQHKYISIKSKFSAENEIEEHSVYFNEYPKVGEYINKDIGSGLRVIVPLALYGNTQHTYPIADSIEYHHLIKELNNIKQTSISGTDLDTRVADVIITWNIFQHFFPYFNCAQTDWGNDLKIGLENAYTDKTIDEFQKTLEKMTAKLKDGHIVVYSSMGNAERYLPPLKWEWIQGKLVVTKVLDQSVNLHQGDIVTNINGTDPEDYFKDADQYISAATPGYLNYRAQITTLEGARGSSISVTVKGPDNIKTETKLNRTLTEQNYFKEIKSQDSIKVINKDVMYVNIGITPMKSIISHLEQLQKTKVIICDLRGYPYDESPFIQYLLMKQDTTKWMYTPYIIYPDQEKIVGYNKEGWNLMPLSPHISAKIIFIIDSQDISAAESFMSFIEHYKLATIIGQPTAGTNGVVNYILLPGGYSLQYTGMKVLKLDGSQHHGVGTVPDIYLEKTIEGVRENKDEFLDKAIEMANSYNK
jgi:C-terminal processing protease CtpA/Prc